MPDSYNSNIDRLKHLAGLTDMGYEEDYDPEQQAADEAMERERHVVRMIRHAFAKLELVIDTMSNIAVMYDDKTREATVLLDEEPHGIPLERIAALMTSGLGTNYRVRADHEMHVEISFKVDEAIDHAEIS